jgi:tetratricopeptide (TPR) repeat protein
MKQILLFTMVFFFNSAVYAQQVKLDSLLNELKNTNLNDSLRIDLFNELSFEYSRFAPEIGLKYADSALQLSENQSLLGKRANSLNSFGVNYWYMGEDLKALQMYKEVMAYYKSVDDERGTARMANNIALIYYNNADYKNALQHHDYASDAFRRLGMKKNLINSLTNSGVVFLAISDYPKALALFLEALSYSEVDDVTEKGNLFNNLGLVYKNLEQFPLAIDYYTQAITLFEELGHLQAKALAMGNLANILSELGDYEKSGQMLLDALSINLTIGNKRRIASDYANLGVLKRRQGDKVMAKEYYNDALKLYEEIDDPLNMSFVYLEIAKLASKPKDRILFQTKALAKAETAGSISRKMEAHHQISGSYEELNNPSLALYHYKRYTSLKDSLFNQENEKKITRIQIEYEYQMKEKELNALFSAEKEILELEKEKEAQLSSLYMMASAGLLLLIGWIIFLNKKKLNYQKAKLSAEHQMKQTELEMKALRAQMNPHFIFNALSSISNFLLKNQAEDADYYLGKFSKLIRMTLENSEYKEISLHQEILMLEQYVALESLRLGKKLLFEVKCDPENAVQMIMVPPLILQPLVENAIWHGISKVECDGVIQVIICKSGSNWEIKIRDNGAGRKKRDLDSVAIPHQPMGISITQGRLDLLNKGNLDGTKTISYKDLEHGLEVGILLPA